MTTKYVEEEIGIDIKYMEKDIENMMVNDSGAPILLVSQAWFEKYVEVAKIDEEEVKKSESYQRFRLGKTLYMSKEKVCFPVVLKTDKGDLIKREVTANIIESEEVTFLCGEQALCGEDGVIYF